MNQILCNLYTSFSKKEHDRLGAEEAREAHNLEVGRSKLLVGTFFSFLFFKFSRCDIEEII